MAVFIIAEAGVNHNGSLELAKKLVDIAANAGADAVKFQSFRADCIATEDAPKAAYQLQETSTAESQLQMLARLELSESDHQALIAHASARKIAFLSTPFDMPSLVMLTERFAIKTIKVPSGEITNAPFLLEIARRADKAILSTGMSTLEEVRVALGVLAFGFTAARGNVPGEPAFAQTLESEAGQQALRERVTLLHCTSEYPAPFSAVNLRAMDTLRNAFDLPVGYSDHTLGPHAAIAAVARGATVIEKHYTLDRHLPGPDHKASLEPAELIDMVRAIRNIEQALGDGIKRPTAGELRNRELVRRSIVATRDISKGEQFSEQNIGCKRPADGIAPIDYWRLLASVAKRRYARNETIDE